MKTIEWLLETSLNGCDLHGSVEVEDAATEDEIETAVREDMWDRLSLTWWEKDRPDTSEGEPSALIERLHRSIQTAFNDDYSEVGTDKRLRHAARIDAMQDAADALARQSADNERLRGELARLQAESAQETRERDFHKSRADTAESALAALRERVRAVLGPFANFYISQDSTGEVVSAAQFRAARALLADMEKETGDAN